MLHEKNTEEEPINVQLYNTRVEDDERCYVSWVKPTYTLQEPFEGHNGGNCPSFMPCDICGEQYIIIDK